MSSRALTLPVNGAKIPSLTVEKIKNCCKSNVYRLYGSLDTIFKI